MARTKRQYSDEDKAAALETLALYRGNVSLAARNLGMPRKTLTEWANGQNMPVDAVAKIRQVKKGTLAERFADVVDLLLDHVPSKIADANLQAVMTSIGIAVDKRQLMEGKPTVITDDLSALTDDELKQRLAEAEAREVAQTGTEAEAI